MIDLGLTKIALIGVVALVVIGPEKLPRVARMAGTLYGRAQRYISQVKSEVSREMEIDEFRRLQKEVEEAAMSAGDSVKQAVGQMHTDIDNTLYDRLATMQGMPYKQPSDLSGIKSRAFRKKCLIRTTAIPLWYKHRTSQRVRVTSAAARVARFRPGRKTAFSFFG